MENLTSWGSVLWRKYDWAKSRSLSAVYSIWLWPTWVLLFRMRWVRAVKGFPVHHSLSCSLSMPAKSSGRSIGRERGESQVTWCTMWYRFQYFSKIVCHSLGLAVCWSDWLPPFSSLAPAVSLNLSLTPPVWLSLNASLPLCVSI